MTFDYYRTPHPVAYTDEKYAPVPGWGMTPNLAGPSMLAVGAMDATPSWWGRQSGVTKALLIGGVVLAVGGLGAFAWYMTKGSKREYEENLSLEDVKEKARHVKRKVKSGYEASKPHLERAARGAKRAYQRAKPHAKRVAKGAAKSAAKLLTAAGEKAKAYSEAENN